MINFPKKTDLSRAIRINIPAILTGWVIAPNLAELMNISNDKIVILILSKVISFDLINNERLQQSFRQAIRT